jgi:hypothetical protein
MLMFIPGSRGFVASKYDASDTPGVIGITSAIAGFRRRLDVGEFEPDSDIENRES